MSVRRLHSVARFAVIRESIGAHVGKIADAVEGPSGYDPSGLLVSATDTADGVSVSLGVGAGVATPDPATALGWSVPLRDATGRLVESVGDYGIDGYIRAIAKANPAAFATPSNLMLFVAYLADGPLETATSGFAVGIDNATASRWRPLLWRLNSSSWSTASQATTLVAATAGVHGTWASANPNTAGSAWTCSAAAIPHGGSGSGPFVFSGFPLGGASPHLAFGVGWSGTPAGADTVTLKPLARLLLPDAADI